MSQVAENVGQQKGVKTLRTKSSATTRFIASQLSSMERIVLCFPEYLSSLYEYAGLKRNTDEDDNTYDEEEALLCGQDFLLDILGVIDAVTPLVKLMEASQNLQTPGWRIVPNGARTLAIMNEMLEDLQGTDEEWGVSPNLWSQLSKHTHEILQKTFKGTDLVDGWLIENTATQKSKKMLNWRCRQTFDCKTDLIEFLTNLISEIRSRLEKSVSPAVKVLFEAVDLNDLMRITSGKWCKSLNEPLLAGAKEEMRKSFSKFYRFLKSEKHLHGLEEDPNLVLAQVVNALKLIVWDSSTESSKLRNLVFHPLQGGQPMPTGHPVKVEFKENGFLLASDFYFEDGSQYSRTLNTETLTNLIYSSVYDKMGKNFCVAYDIALAKTGTEAVVESVYSVMKTQLQSGAQKNDSIVARTKVDWHLPKTPLGIDEFINDVTEKYTLNHCYPFTRQLKTSKVMDRLKKDEGKIPPRPE